MTSWLHKRSRLTLKLQSGMLEVLLTLGVPILAGLVLTLLRAVASQKPLSNETTRDLALDMTFLAIGAAGSVFHNPKLQTRMGGDAVPGLAGLIVVDLLVAAILCSTCSGFRRRSLPSAQSGSTCSSPDFPSP